MLRFFGMFSVFRMLKFGLLMAAMVAFAAVPVFAEEKKSEEKPAAADSTTEKKAEEESEGTNPFAWTLDNVMQPFFNAMIMPISLPLHYAFDNGVIETFQNLITFGEKRNIFIYPVFNFKPGSSTLIGFCYRHREMLLEHDYYSLSSNFYANGDIYFNTRYSKRDVFGVPVSLGTKFAMDMDRDASFTLPGKCI